MTLHWSNLYPYYLRFKSNPHPEGNFHSCAVRMSMCLHHAGAFNKHAYKHAGNKVSKHGWAMIAEQLYQWERLHGLGRAQEIAVGGEDWSHLPGQNGIMYLRDCWVRDYDKSDAERTGDHFDLYFVGQGLVSAILWPEDFPSGPFGLIGSCRDGKVRYWPVS